MYSSFNVLRVVASSLVMADFRGKVPSYLESRKIVEPKYRCGRNQPCPCGSGKKFKMCCIQSS